MPIIKRYANRKLYDSQARCYVTLDDIRQMIQSGESIEVIDHRTGENLTSATMVQIIFEQEKRIGGLLPKVMLSHIIQVGDTTFRAIQDSIRAFIDPFQYVEDDIKRRIQTLLEQKKISEEEAHRLNQSLLDPSLRPASLTMEVDRPAQAADVKDIQAILQQIEDLDRQLEEIKQKKMSRQ